MKQNQIKDDSTKQLSFRFTNAWPSEFPIEMELETVGFCVGRITRELGKNSEQRREPTTNSTYI